MTPRPLWLTPARRAALLEAARRGEQWLAPIASAARDGEGIAPSGGDDRQRMIIRAALDAVLRQRPASARRALEWWREEAREAARREDLLKAHAALCGAAAADCAAGLWSDEERAGFLEAARGLAAAFFEISPGNPHAIGNNWWAVTHSGLYVLACAMAALGGSTPVAGRAPGELAAWAWGRLVPFLGHFGPSGAFHEGLGYMGYTCSHLLPAILLRQSLGGGEVVERAPGLRRLARLVFTAAIEGPPLSDVTGLPEGWGRMLSWNDAGAGFLPGCGPLLAIVLAPESERAAFRARWDRLAGHLRPGAKPDEFCSALVFHAIFYPEAGGLSSTDPAPLHFCDTLHGLWIARNRLCDSGDTVAGAYARGRHPGGHSHHDAGSIRFSSHGRDWILGGGQARPQARFQSRFVPSDHDDSARPGCGLPMFLSEDGFCFGMDLRGAHGAYSERHVALRPDPSRAQLAVLDLVDDHLAGRHWLWCLTFSPGLECAIEGSRVLLRAPDGAVMEIAFLLDRPESITLETAPKSRRVFANTKVVEYQERPVLVAKFPGPSIASLVSLAVNAAPARRGDPATLDIRFGEDHWERPFREAFPRRMGLPLRGQCKFPAAGAE